MSTPNSVAPGEGRVYVGVVHAADGVRFVAAGASRAALGVRLAEYVQRQAFARLESHDAVSLHRLLERGETEAAIERYFASVAKRWDEEWLYTDVVELADGDALPPLIDIGY